MWTHLWTYSWLYYLAACYLVTWVIVGYTFVMDSSKTWGEAKDSLLCLACAPVFTPIMVAMFIFAAWCDVKMRWQKWRNPAKFLQTEEAVDWL